MIFTPGKLYRLQRYIGFDHIDDRVEGVWIAAGELLLFLDYIEDPDSEYRLGNSVKVLCFLFDNVKLWRPQNSYYDYEIYKEEEC